MLRNYLTIDGIFEKEELYAFIEKYDNFIPKKPLGVLGTDTYKGRAAEGIWIREKESVSERFKHLVSGITGLPIENQESPHLVRYDEGGEYKHHHDYFYSEGNYYATCMSEGGQRVFSSLLYLNDDFEGGETDFPKYNVTVKPKIGTILTWRNLNVDKTVNINSLHAGLPVTRGKKYIMIIWVRENACTAKLKPVNVSKTTRGIKL